MDSVSQLERTGPDAIRIQLLSDLHLEVERGSQPLYTYEFPVHAPNLALLGDIGWTRDERLFDWLEAQLERFQRVFFVAGNHEPYIATLDESATLLQAFEKRSAAAHATNPSKGDFIFLNRTRYDLTPTLTLLGCTLWSALAQEDMDILSWSLTDFKRISSFTPASYATVHNADLAWLTASIESIRAKDSARKVVVFTHHAPTVEGTGDPKFLGGPTNSAFATELTGTLAWGVPVILWAFGHTHWSCDFDKDGVRVVSNQRGYGEGHGALIFLKLCPFSVVFVFLAVI